MAASAQWQPQEEGFKEICSLVEQQISPSSDKSKIWQQPQHYSQFPDFNNYLAFIFARAESKSVEVRQAAGLLLKNNLKAAFKAMPASNQEYIKSELLPCLGAGDRQIWSTAGTIISVLVQLEGVFGWPELLHTLVKCLDSNDLNHMEGALDALSKICEDIPQVLDSETLELSERPINIFLPRLLQFFQSPHASLRKLSLGSVNQYIMLMPTVLYISMDKFLQGLFVLANDPAAEVRKLVCAAFVQLIEVRPAFLEWRSQDPQPVGVKIWRGFEGSAPEGVGLREGHERFDKVLMGLLQRILDNNKRVQEAACSAFTTLEEEAAEELVPRLDVILQHLMCAFGKYQRRNLRIVYDAIGTLADAVGAELNQPMYLDVLMPPLIAKWQQLSNADKDLFPLLECYTSIAQALGTGFSQFGQPVFQRCINIIQTQHLAKVDPASAGFQYDKEFVVCSLDLLSGLTEGLGSEIESLISQSNLRDLLLQCCMDDAPDIRQSAFALLGDLARVCPIHLHQRLPEFLDVASKQLSTPKLKEMSQ